MICWIYRCSPHKVRANFNINIRGLSVNKFKNAQFTFQTGLHKDDKAIFNYIMNTLNCCA